MATEAQIEARKERANARAKAWYEANKERANANSAAWAAANPGRRNAIKQKSAEKHFAASKARRALDNLLNPEKRKLAHASYYARNRAKLTADAKLWQAANPEKVKRYKRKTYERSRDRWTEYAHDRRARKLRSGGRLSPGIVPRLMRLQKGRCAVCRCNLAGGKRHLDHVVPLALGGPHDDSNVQLLCAACNLSKGARHPVEFMRSKGFLI